MNATNAAVAAVATTRTGRQSRHGAGRSLPVLLVLTGLLTGLLTACSDDQPVDTCAWMRATPGSSSAPASPGDLGVTVVLVDDSSSVRGASSAAQSPDYAAAIGRRITELVGRRDVVSVGSFSSGQQIAWSADRLSTDWKAGNDNGPNQDERRKEAADCLTHDVSAAERAAPSGGGTDVLAAMSSAAGLFGGVRGPRHLLVLTDGLPTAGCADLRSAGFTAPQEIDAIAGVCAARQEIPRLAGVDTEFVGLADSASDQPAATPAQRSWLTSLWTALCAKAGAAHCGTEATGGGRVRLSPAAGEGGAEPQVRYGTGRVSTYRLPAAALFAPDSAAVRTSAVPLLTTIAVEARTSPGSRLVVDGYVDPRGSAANDHQLSQARADAVRKQLLDLGAANVTAYGRGVAPGCSQQGGAGGLTPDQMLQCQRRVDIELIRT